MKKKKCAYAFFCLFAVGNFMIYLANLSYSDAVSCEVAGCLMMTSCDRKTELCKCKTQSGEILCSLKPPKIGMHKYISSYRRLSSPFPLKALSVDFCLNILLFPITRLNQTECFFFFFFFFFFFNKRLFCHCLFLICSPFCALGRL